MPRPFKMTPERLDDAVKAYHKDCDNNGIFPDEAGLILYLYNNHGLSLRTYSKYKNGRSPDDSGEPTAKDAEIYKEFGAVLARAQLHREAWLARKMVSDNKAAQGCFNALKQPKNGGYQDKPAPVEAPKMEIIVKMDKLGGDGAFG